MTIQTLKSLRKGGLRFVLTTLIERGRLLTADVRFKTRSMRVRPFHSDGNKRLFPLLRKVSNYWTPEKFQYHWTPWVQSLRPECLKFGYHTTPYDFTLSHDLPSGVHFPSKTWVVE